MRPLTEEETRVFFEKLAKYIGRNIRHLIDREDEEYAFRLHKDRVFYVKASIARKAMSFSRDSLISVGICFGKFTKTKKFRLHITALDYLAPYALHKVWVKPAAEMSFLYGNHVLKAGLGRMSEDTPQYEGVIVMNMGDVPLGFGVSARSTTDSRDSSADDIIVFRQADTGEYVRAEDTLLS